MIEEFGGRYREQLSKTYFSLMGSIAHTCRSVVEFVPGKIIWPYTSIFPAILPYSRSPVGLRRIPIVTTGAPGRSHSKTHHFPLPVSDKCHFSSLERMGNEGNKMLRGKGRGLMGPYLLVQMLLINELLKLLTICGH